MDRSARWCDDARDRLVAVTDRSWARARVEIDGLLPLRALTTQERLLARVHVRDLALHLDLSDQEGERWLRVFGRAFYGGEMPRPAEERLYLVVRGRREGSERVVVSGGVPPRPLPPAEVGESFDWGPQASAGGRKALARALVEEFTGSRDLAFEFEMRVADDLVAGLADQWEITRPTLMAILDR